MAIYSFAWNMLAWSITVAILVPIMIPWGMVSFKIWHGAKAIDEDLKEQLWWRSSMASIMLLVGAIVCPLLDFATIDWFEMPAGMVHVVFLVLLISFASWMLMYFFSLEDFFQGLIMLAIYWYVPVGLMALIAGLLRNPLFEYVMKWLPEPKA